MPSKASAKAEMPSLARPSTSFRVTSCRWCAAATCGHMNEAMLRRWHSFLKLTCQSHVVKDDVPLTPCSGHVEFMHRRIIAASQYHGHDTSAGSFGCGPAIWKLLRGQIRHNASDM